MKSNGPDILSHLFLLSYVALFFFPIFRIITYDTVAQHQISSM